MSTAEVSDTMSEMARNGGSGGLGELGAWRRADPKVWAKMIRDAMKDSNGRIQPAADALGISRRQLFRFLKDPLLKDVYIASPGRPVDIVVRCSACGAMGHDKRMCTAKPSPGLRQQAKRELRRRSGKSKRSSD